MSIEKLKQYAEKVNKRGPKNYDPPYDSYRFIAAGLPTDIKNWGHLYDSDEAFLRHVEYKMDGDDLMKAFQQFRRYYHAWRRRHQ